MTESDETKRQEARLRRTADAMGPGEQILHWFEQSPRVCLMCETDPATTFLELWQDWPDRPLPGQGLDFDDCTPVCERCCRALLEPIPNSPFPSPSSGGLQ
jgi:hypothetical protein